MLQERKATPARGSSSSEVSEAEKYQATQKQPGSLGSCGQRPGALTWVRTRAQEHLPGSPVGQSDLSLNPSCMTWRCVSLGQAAKPSEPLLSVLPGSSLSGGICPTGALSSFTLETACTTFREGWPDLLSLDLLEVAGAGQRYTGRVRAHLAAGLTEPAGGGGPNTTEPALDSSATAARGKTGERFSLIFQMRTSRSMYKTCSPSAGPQASSFSPSTLWLSTGIILGGALKCFVLC